MKWVVYERILRQCASKPMSAQNSMEPRVAGYCDIIMTYIVLLHSE